MAEIEPSRYSVPEGDDRLALLGLLAHARYHQVPATPNGDLGVSTLEPVLTRVCQRGRHFEELPLVFQTEVLAEAGINPTFALDAARLLPAIRAVTAALEQGMDTDRLTETIRGMEAA